MKKLFYILLLLMFPIILIGQPGIKYQGNAYIPDSTTVFGRPVAQYTIIVDEETGNLWKLDIAGTATMTLQTATKTAVGGNVTVSPTDLSFNSDRPTLRSIPVGTTIAGTTVFDVLEWPYYTPPVLSCSITGTYPVEVGTSNSVTISGTTVIHSDVLSNGQVNSSGVTDPLTPVFGASASYSYSITYAPLQTPSGDYTEHSYTFSAQQDYVGVESGTATSSNVTMYDAYPYFYTVSSTDYTGASGTTIYTNFTKKVQSEGTKSVPFNGTGYSYIVVPDTWSALSKVLDGNGFDVTSSFLPGTAVTYSSTGLTNDYVNKPGTMYKSNTSGSYSSVTYTFYF